MTVILTLRGALEPVRLEDDFNEATTALQNAGMRGMSFIVSRTDEGENICISMDNILTVIEVNE